MVSEGIRLYPLSKWIIIRVMVSNGLRGTCYSWNYQKD